MNKSEILAPVGGTEHLIAAVRSGADAVYLGTDAFNARQNAENFGKDKLLNAVSYCHARNVKVYVTMNTLIKDDETDEAIKNIKLIAESGADGVIVQDLSVAKLFRKHCPDIPLHASTQMAVHNVMGLKALEKLGFRRVVPARELTLKEIQTLINSTDMEIEVFIHGALCMSVSGNCYLSSMIGGRSGNRGRCAQPCRLNFNINGREHALSLKDSSAVEYIKQLEQIGVASFKIEGRMKRPEYVSATVTACKNAINGLPYDIETLKSVFSRSGFTDGYITGHRNLNMFGYRTKDDVIAANSVLNELANSYKDEKQIIDIDMTFSADKKSSSLTVTDGINTVTVNGEIPQTAINKPLDEFYSLRSFQKTGGTIFNLINFTSDIKNGISLSASSMNNLRREALEELYKLRSKITPWNFTENKESENSSVKSKSEIKYKLRFSSKSQVPDNTHNAEIILPYGEILSNTELIEKYKNSLIAELPALIFPDNEDNFKIKMTELKSKGIKKVYCENVGVADYSKSLGFTVISGSCMNIMNTSAVKKYEDLFCDEITVSHEIDMKHIAKIRHSKPFGLIGYGFLPLMKFRACPAQSENGCKNCKGLSVIKDRLGKNFYILCSNKKYSSLLNSVPLYIGDKQIADVDFITLYFTFEKKETCEKVFDLFRNKLPLPSEKTGGLYYRELL